MLWLDPWLLVLLALLLLTLPLGWLLAAVLAGVFHELCHLVAVRLLGGRVTGLTLSPGGASMEGVLPPGLGQLPAILAGPAGSLCLLTLCHVFPRLALCGAVQGIFNLLPLPWLDGGRAVHCLAEAVRQRRLFRDTGAL